MPRRRLQPPRPSPTRLLSSKPESLPPRPPSHPGPEPAALLTWAERPCGRRRWRKAGVQPRISAASTWSLRAERPQQQLQQPPAPSVGASQCRRRRRLLLFLPGQAKPSVGKLRGRARRAWSGAGLSRNEPPPFPSSPPRPPRLLLLLLRGSRRSDAPPACRAEPRRGAAASSSSLSRRLSLLLASAIATC